MTNAKHSRKWLGLIVPFGTIVLLGLVLLFSSQPAQAQTGADNATCLACHSGEGQIYEFPNGDTVSVTVNPEHYQASVHGAFNCTTCHTDIQAYPHPAQDAGSKREYTYAARETCQECHEDQYVAGSCAHGTASIDGNLNAPVCADCHEPHTQQSVRDAQGNLRPEERLNIPETCARCHSNIYTEYSESVHGSAIKENNPDVATCTDCHGVHQVVDPTTAQFRLSSPQMCANCHTDVEKMAKYGLNTGVLDTYVADFHGTTVTLFEKTEPDQITNKPVCYDCHGIHDISAVDDPQKGISIRENLSITCQRCHPEADTMNFPDSWLGHYTPDPQKYPLVYYVNLVYLILIPLVLGAMLVFNLSDVYHKLRTRGKKKEAVPTEPDVPTEPRATVVPAEPEIPTEPEVPEIPTEPDVPTEPRAPVVPTEPEIPTEPEVSEIPIEPDVPTQLEVEESSETLVTDEKTDDTKEDVQ